MIANIYYVWMWAYTSHILHVHQERSGLNVQDSYYQHSVLQQSLSLETDSKMTMLPSVESLCSKAPTQCKKNLF